jgi:UTP:GlnB (protein PII) uridylyltransferase
MREGRASLGDVAAFAGSMPAAYRAAFDPIEVAAHAAIAARRGASPTYVESWDELPGRVLAVCVVADDHPGLLARVSAALATNEVDVVRAYGYGRTNGAGAREALMFFWVRRVVRGELASLARSDVDALAALLEALVRGDASYEAPAAVQPRTGATTVRFERGQLTVEATDRPGLLLAVTQTLYREGLQIVGVRATSERGRVVDRFDVVERDGSEIGPERTLALQTAVLAAIDGEKKDDVSA